MKLFWGAEYWQEKRKQKSLPWVNALVFFILFLSTLAAYYPSLSGNFVDIDDLGYVPDNEYIRDLSWGGIYRIFTSVIMFDYFPLQLLSYAIDYSLWGINPFGYRLTNLLIHVGNAFLVYLFFRHLLRGRLWLALAGSLMFALHPVNVESVAWISERKSLLSLFLLLLSFLTYIRYLDGESKRGAYAISLAIYFLSLLAKVSSVVMPLLLILYDICWTSRPRREWIKDKVPFLILSGFFSWLVMYIHQMQRTIPDIHGGHMVYSLLTMVNLVVEYLLSLLVPVYLYFYYETLIVKSFWEYQFFLSLSLLCLLLFLAIRWYRENRPLFFCVLWFFIPLLPVMNLVPLDVMRADRYLYLPSIGFSFFLILGLQKILALSSREIRWVTVGIFCLILGTFSFVTEKQSTIWKSSFTLWSHVLEQLPTRAKPYKRLGNVARDAGQRDLAIFYYREALLRDPKEPSALNDLGELYLNQGKMKEAGELFQRALKSDPNYPDAYNNMGIIYAEMGEDTQAIAAFEKAMKEKISYATAANNLGVIYRKQRNIQKSIAYFQKAIKADPTFTPAQANLALALKEQGKLDR